MEQRQECPEIRGKNSSIAWFKLAELISRGEKEKTLNLYRVLSHSFEERAYVLQLEGDILWAFEDVGAVERYKQAAFLYQKEDRPASAAAIYEHLLTLQPRNSEHLCNAILLYAKFSWHEKIKECFSSLFDLFEQGEVMQEQIVAVLDKTKTILHRDEFESLLLVLQKRIPEIARRYTKV